MDLRQAQSEMAELFRQYGLSGWRFKLDNAVARNGSCSHAKRTISMSRQLTVRRTDAEVRNTMLHELAHALVGPGHGHDAVWRAKAISIGCNGARCTDTAPENRVPGKWVAVCPGCSVRSERHRRPSKPSACATCCRRFNGGRFSLDYLFVYRENRQRVA
jgi:predicted SprT family Zn-dependent metalloprotease